MMSKKLRQLLSQEELILEATEELSKALERTGMTRAAFARRAEYERSHITHLLSGRRNMTLRTLAILADTLGYRVRLKFEKNA